MERELDLVVPKPLARFLHPQVLELIRPMNQFKFLKKKLKNTRMGLRKKILILQKMH